MLIDTYLQWLILDHIHLCKSFLQMQVCLVADHLNWDNYFNDDFNQNASYITMWNTDKSI